MNVCSDVWPDKIRVGVLGCRCNNYRGGVSNRTPVTACVSSEITVRFRSLYFRDKKPGIINLVTSLCIFYFNGTGTPGHRYINLLRHFLCYIHSPRICFHLTSRFLRH